jgi:hypothetical protein
MATSVLTKALKTDLNKPVVSDPTPEFEKKQKEAVEEELKTSGAVSELEQQKVTAESQAKAAREATKVSTTEEAEKRKSEREEPLLTQEKDVNEALMKNHFEPTPENLKDHAALFSLINVIGFAIGAGGKKNAQQAMSAMNGMLEGHQQGRADLYKTESAKFDKNFKALQQRAVFVEKELAKSLQEYTRDKDAGEQRANATFAQAEADFLRIYAQKNGLVKAYERAKEIRKSMDKAVDEERRRKERREDKTDADIKHRELILATTPSKETPQEKREAKMGTAGPARTIYDKTGKMLPDERTAKEVQANVQGIRTIESLQKDLTDPEIRTGVFSKTSLWAEKIKSIFDSGPVEYETAVNQQLTGTDKTTLFLKKALLSSYAIERAAKNGQRLTVQDMKTVGPVLDPTNYSATTYAQLLDDRRKDLYDVMADYGFDQTDVKKLSTASAYTPYGQAESAPAAVPAPAPQSEKGRDEKGSFHYEYNADRTKRRKVYD